ncbi:MAG: hypothetical protein AB1760_16020, partial [Pseudomonadota bacterium]
MSRSYGRAGGRGREAALSSPWDVTLAGGQLFIAMAGSHQIWALDPATGEVRVHAGTGREALVDGPLLQAALNQPSGIVSDGRFLYIADSEASAVRRADIDPGGRLETIVGTGLFDFGDVDGAGDSVRLQHPLDIELRTPAGADEEAPRLLVADTYNHKVKIVDPAGRSSRTLAGSGSPGLKDGRSESAMFEEPAGLSVAGGLLFIADTDNHALRLADLAGGTVATLELAEIGEAAAVAPSQPDAGGAAAIPPSQVTTEGAPEKEEEEFDEEEAEVLPAQTVAPGRATLVIDIIAPPGHHLSLKEQWYFGWSSSDPEALGFPEQPQEFSGPDPPLPLRIPVDIAAPSAAGRTGRPLAIDIELTLYYCPDAEESLCLLDAPLLRQPLEVSEGSGNAEVKVAYQIVRDG